MTVKQVADLLGVTRFRVHKMRGQGQLTGRKLTNDTGTDYWVFEHEEVERLIEQRRKIAAGELPPRGGPKPKSPPEKQNVSASE